jgi:hypothetical protein
MPSIGPAPNAAATHCARGENRGSADALMGVVVVPANRLMKDARMSTTFRIHLSFPPVLVAEVGCCEGVAWPAMAGQADLPWMGRPPGGLAWWSGFRTPLGGQRERARVGSL